MRSKFLHWAWLPVVALVVLAAVAVFTLRAAAASPPPPPCPPVFADEFNGPSIDSARWKLSYKSGRTEQQFYSPEALQLADGSLHLTADVQPQQGYPYTSGAINTLGTFSQMYGYFEMRAKLPSGQGLWSAFWLLHTGTLPWMEIDVVELLGHEPTRLHLSHHWRDENNDLASAKVKYDGPDYSQAYHTYAINWEPDLLQWYVDGVLLAETDEHVPAEPMFLLVNLAVGGDWPGPPDATTPFPASLDVDYVRVYEAGCRPPTPAPAQAEAMPKDLGPRGE